VPVLKTTATTGAGIEELAAAINDFAARRSGEGARERRRRRARYLIARAAADLVARRVKQGGDSRLDQLADEVLGGALTAEEAALRLL
jgi:LAO/AO transport system kinase